MTGNKWHRMLGSFVEAWTQASLALDPTAYALSLQATEPDVLEDQAISTYRSAAAAVRPSAAPATGALRLDVLAG